MNKNHFSAQDLQVFQDYREKIAIADNNNILCHCKDCDHEWVDSSFTVICQCGSKNVEMISCWQFPDD